MVDMVMELTGCGPIEAAKALMDYKTIEDAVDALLCKPTVAGDKYIPEKPKTNTGMTAEQEERCKKGRWLQDKINVVFSAAHPRNQTQPEQHPTTVSALPLEGQPTLTEELPMTNSVSLPDSVSKTIQSNPQSEMLR